MSIFSVGISREVQWKQFQIGLLGNSLGDTVPVALKRVAPEAGESNALPGLSNPVFDPVQRRLVLWQSVRLVGRKQRGVVFLLGNVPALG
jgi:hypothetical protein